MGNRRLPFVDSDGWLAPVADKIEARHERFIARLERIRESAGSLTDYANGYRYFGLTRDDAAGGWWFREWAPGAHDIYLYGDFNKVCISHFP